MTHEQITALVEKQRGYFSSGSTLPAAVRVEALRKLRQALSDNEGRIAEALHSDLGKSPQEGYMCETALDMSLERILEMGEKWGKLLDDGVLVSSHRFDTHSATAQDEGYFLRYRRFGTESDLSGQFCADFYVTAEGFASVSITDLYDTGDLLTKTNTLISWQDAANDLPIELEASRMQPVLEEITVARLTWCPIRQKDSPSGMAFTPAWVLAFTAQNDGHSCEMHAIFNAITGQLITGNWY